MARVCTEPKCVRPFLARGYCRLHYDRYIDRDRRVAYHALTRARRLIKQKEYRRKNAANITKYLRNWRATKPDVANARCRRWKKLHPASVKAASRRRKIIKRGVSGSHTEAQWLTLLSIYNYSCACCKLPKVLTRDHVKPLSKGGSDSITNIQPLCRSCNSKKGVKTKRFARGH